MKTKHLRFNCQTAGMECNENRHPQKVMQELGISYCMSTPQSIADQWWFWNCENYPEPLPEYLSILDVDPMKCIGNGINKEEAEMIVTHKKSVESGGIGGTRYYEYIGEITI